MKKIHAWNKLKDWNSQWIKGNYFKNKQIKILKFKNMTQTTGKIHHGHGLEELIL